MGAPIVVVVVGVVVTVVVGIDVGVEGTACRCIARRVSMGAARCFLRRSFTVICLGLLSMHLLPLCATQRPVRCTAVLDSRCAPSTFALYRQLQRDPKRPVWGVATGWRILGNGVKAPPCRAMAFVTYSLSMLYSCQHDPLRPARAWQRVDDSWSGCEHWGLYSLAMESIYRLMG